MKPAAALLILLLCASCSVSYTENLFSVEEEFGYDVNVLTPDKEIIGDFVYLSDSNTVLATPTKLMRDKLNEGYRILIPIPWGTPGRSSATLDTAPNRLRGVSFSLEKLRAEVDSNYRMEILAEGFYSPIGLRIARDFRADELILVQPIANSLQQELIWQLQENRDTLSSSLFSLWNIKNDSALAVFSEVLNSNDLSKDRFFGVHYSSFLRSYWTETHTVDNLKVCQKNTMVEVLLSPVHPLYSKLNKKEWGHRGIPILLWNEKYEAYSISSMEKSLLDQ